MTHSKKFPIEAKVTLVGKLFQPRTGTDGKHRRVTASLSTSIAEKNPETGDYETIESQYHFLLPMNKQAAESLRNFPFKDKPAQIVGTPVSYVNKKGTTSTAVLVYSEICVAESWDRQNHVEMRGRLARNPSIYKIASGHEVAELTIPVDRRFQKIVEKVDEVTGVTEKVKEWTTETTWFKVLVHDPDLIDKARTLQKGHMVKVVGELIVEESNARSGGKHHKPVVRAADIPENLLTPQEEMDKNRLAKQRQDNQDDDWSQAPVNPYPPRYEWPDDVSDDLAANDVSRSF